MQESIKEAVVRYDTALNGKDGIETLDTADTYAVLDYAKSAKELGMTDEHDALLAHCGGELHESRTSCGACKGLGCHVGSFLRAVHEASSEELQQTAEEKALEDEASGVCSCSKVYAYSAAIRCISVRADAHP